MEGYLGAEIVPVEKTEYANYTPADWALYFVTVYGGIDGAHHKDWVLDQVARVLNGTEVIVKEAKWEGGYAELRVSLGEPSQRYLDWVTEIKFGEDGPDTYGYDEGVAP